MDAVILAAGYGSRLSSVSASKPLAAIGPFRLIEISIRQLVRAGATRVIVVTGHRAAEVEAVLPEISNRVGRPVIARRVADFSRPNGYSVIAGARECPGDYLLVMADHVLSTSILAKLCSSERCDRDVTLAIDRRVQGDHIDPDDATWVTLDDSGFIKGIGKALAKRDAADCGAFLAGPQLAFAIEDAIAQGLPGSLSDGMQVLANRRRAATLDIGQDWWIDVDDPSAHARAVSLAPIHLPALFARNERAPASIDAQRG